MFTTDDSLCDDGDVCTGTATCDPQLDCQPGTPLVCDDGVTIAKELTIADPEEDLGVRMIKQAAERTGDAVGDGTTTATILAHAIYAEGLRNVVAGASAVDLRRGLERRGIGPVRGVDAPPDACRDGSRRRGVPGPPWSSTTSSNWTG